MGFEIEGTDDPIEGHIVTGCIVSDRFCGEVLRIYRPEYFTAPFAARVMGWIFLYHKDNGKAPGNSISHIYDLEKKNLQQAERSVIKAFLRGISDKYEREQFDVEFFLKKAKRYFEDRATEILFERGHKLVLAGKARQAQGLLDEHRKVIVETGQSFDPFDIKEAMAFDRAVDDDIVFRFSGVLGDYIGDLRRGWLMSWLGVEKRGKTWVMIEAAFQAVTKKVPTLMVTLEMNKNQMEERIYKRLTGLMTVQEVEDEISNVGYVRYPVFDCVKNRTGRCRRKYASKVRFGQAKTFDPKLGYVPCDFCRKDKELKKEYEMAYWYVAIMPDDLKKMVLERRKLVAKVVAFRKMYGSHLKVISFPPYTAGWKDIRAELDRLYFSEGFKPGLLIVDYFDILARERASDSREAINVIWQRGKAVAQELNCIVMTADQGTKAARGKSNLTEKDTSENKLKDAHVDLKMGLNQSQEEEADGVMRFSMMLHRHRKVHKGLQLLVLHQTLMGQPLLDADYYRIRKSEKTSDEKNF